MSLRNKLVRAAVVVVVAVLGLCIAPAAYAGITLEKATVFLEVPVSQHGSWTARVSDDGTVEGTLTATVRCTGTFVGGKIVTSSICFDPESWLIRDALKKNFNEQTSDYTDVGRQFAWEDREMDVALIDEDNILIGNQQNPVGVPHGAIDVQLPNLDKKGSKLKAEYAKSRDAKLAILKVSGVSAPSLTVAVSAPKVGSEVTAYYYGEYSGSAEVRRNKSFKVYGDIGMGTNLTDIGNTGKLPYTAVGGPVMNENNQLVGILAESASDARSIHMTDTETLRELLQDYDALEEAGPAPEPTKTPSASPSTTSSPTASASPSSEPSDSASPSATASPSPSSTFTPQEVEDEPLPTDDADNYGWLTGLYWAIGLVALSLLGVFVLAVVLAVRAFRRRNRPTDPDQVPTWDDEDNQKKE